MKKNWWKSFYDEYLAAMLLEQADDEIEATLGFLEKRLSLPEGARIYDQCCGTGRLSLPLLRRGYDVIGVDQAALYIQKASQNTGLENLGGEFLVADAFEYTPEEPVDAVINWWTSFGYAEKDEQNAKMIVRAFESLRPGGVFALDFLNLPGVLRNFARDVVTRCPFEAGELVLHLESHLNLEEGAIEKTWRYFLPDGRRVVHETRVCMYMPNELARFFALAGFQEIQIFGSVHGESLNMDSPRCIVVGRKPEAAEIGERE